MTIQSLIADLRKEHGDGWAEAAIARLLNLTAIAVNGDWTPERHQEVNLLREWLSDIVAAGVEKLETDLYGPVLVTAKDANRIAQILRDEGMAGSEPDDYLALAEKMRKVALYLQGGTK